MPARKNTFTITRPADMHVHFRDDHVMWQVAPATARCFDIAVAMPNLVPPITTPQQARDYCLRIKNVVRGINDHFRPLGIAYLTDDTTPESIEEGYRLRNNSGDRSWYAAKFYPANATTNSSAGVTALEKIFRVLEQMEKLGMPLLVHGEMVNRFDRGGEYAPWEREEAFLEHVFPAIAKRFPALKIVLEHITTARAAELILKDKSRRLAATITPHHLWADATDMVRGGFRPDLYCLPMPKTPEDRAQLWILATGGHPRVFAGTDSAPHGKGRKHSGCCPGGAFVAPHAVEAYAATFETAGIFKSSDGVKRFEGFMSLNGPRFYDIPPSSRKMVLVRKEHEYTDEKFEAYGEEILPFFRKDLGFDPKTFPWKVAS